VLVSQYKKRCNVGGLPEKGKAGILILDEEESTETPESGKEL